MEEKFIEELDRSLSGRLLEIWEGHSGLPPEKEAAYRDNLRRQAAIPKSTTTPPHRPARVVAKRLKPCNCGGKIRKQQGENV